jgi:hypothetical protein
LVSTGGPGSIDLVSDSVEACRELNREREVRVAGRVRHPELDAGSGASPVGNSDQRRPVALRPGDVDRRLVSGHQTLVAVDDRVGDRGDCPGMGFQPADVMAHGLRDLVFPLRVEERVPVSGEQRLVSVHARAVLPEDWLGHERGVKIVRHGRVPDDEAERGQVVRCRERVGVLEVDLVLTGSDLVMSRFHLEAHRLQVVDDHPPGALAEVDSTGVRSK